MARNPLLILAVTIFFCEGCTTARIQADQEFISAPSSHLEKRNDLAELCLRFRQFYKDDIASVYEIRLCADLPYDNDPSRVLYKREPGHVFLIFFQIINVEDTISQSFGFYPRIPANVILFKNVKSEIRENRGREYNSHVWGRVSSKMFFSLLDSSIVLAARKYNLNRFNCYDYGLHLFNLAVSSHPIPLQHVKFPFIWGRGGSPVGLYNSLKNLKETDSFWSTHIEIDRLLAPD